MADRRSLPKARWSYTREEKLKVTQWYWNNGQNWYQMCKKFGLNSRTVLRWIKDERKIKDSKKGRKRVEFNRKSQYPAMETTLYKEYRSLREWGIKIKGWWFKARAKQLLEAAHMESQFKFSNAWFHGFKRRYKISLQRPTNKAQHIQKIKDSLFKIFIEKFARRQQ